MASAPTYQTAAEQYAAGVQALFAPASPTITERSSRSIAPPATIAERAEQLAPASDQLTAAAGAKLSAPDARDRTEASQQLLAKALIDLEVSALLLEAAQDEEIGAGSGGHARTERSVATRGGSPLVDQLRVVLGEHAQRGETRERGSVPPRDLAAVRVELCTTASDTLLLITERAGKTGQVAVAGLLGLGAGEIVKAAGVMGMDVAQAFGQGEKVTRLYNLFRDFAVKAYESLLTLLGPGLVQTASTQVLKWVEEVRAGTKLSSLIDMLYRTADTEQAVREIVEASDAAGEQYTAAIERLSALSDTYGKQMALVDRLSRGLGFLGGAAAAVLPYGKLLLAACYILLCAYVIFAGADFVDAQRLAPLDRTPGVRRTVVESLGLG